MIIPWESIESDTLDAIITEFILREGTDYGEEEVPLKTKISQVRQLFKEKKVVLLWSETTETVNLVPADEIKYVDDLYES
ncbi:YheU family protein [Thorsellia kenyensis]|uniref:YheU family protein n=1 Tax=Thorsellia kenyensis TaxID=1549888 RepID=A0ABV6C9J6_9GAMM